MGLKQKDRKRERKRHKKKNKISEEIEQREFSLKVQKTKSRDVASSIGLWLILLVLKLGEFLCYI